METLEQLVLAELGEHLEAADRLAAAYARDYAAWLRSGRSRNPVQKPPGLHPQIAKLVREVVMDADLVERRVAV